MKGRNRVGALSWIAAVVLAMGSAGAQDTGVQVADAKLGKAVVDREIQDETTSFAVGEKAVLWLRVTGGPGELRVHWKHGEATDTVSLGIGGDPWRTWANKTLHTAGYWMVTVTDASGATLKELAFDVK